MLQTSNGSNIQPTPSLREAITQVIDNELLSIVLQPIVDLRTGSVAGYEALSRPHDTARFPHAGVLYESAEQVGLLAEVESLARRLAMERVRHLPRNLTLFINNSPAVFYGSDFVDRLTAEMESTGVDPTRIVLEVTERTPLDNKREPMCQLRVIDLRERGFQVAIDDVGAGDSGLNRIMAIRPNWLKLDRELIQSIEFDPLKQHLLRFFVHFARLSSVGLIAEGIERTEELQTLINLGVQYGQGFLLGRPVPEPGPIAPAIRTSILESAISHDARQCGRHRSAPVVTLGERATTVPADRSIGTVRDRLRLMPLETGVVVTRGTRCVGWSSRAEIEAAHATGQAARPIGDIATDAVGIVPESMLLDEAMLVAASRRATSMEDPLIVQRSKGRYDILPVRRLLQSGATIQTVGAHIDPVTGLPNRVEADRWIDARLRSGDAVTVVYFDLSRFAAYNQSYGFELGDEMLRRLAGLLVEQSARDVGMAFLAHLGGDRFMAAFHADPAPVIDRVTAAFEESLTEFFSPIELASRRFGWRDAVGTEHRVPLTTLRAVHLCSEPDRLTGAAELHREAERNREAVRAMEHRAIHAREAIINPDADGSHTRMTGSIPMPVRPSETVIRRQGA